MVLPSVNRSEEECRMNILVFCWFFLCADFSDLCFLPFVFCNTSFLWSNQKKIERSNQILFGEPFVFYFFACSNKMKKGKEKRGQRLKRQDRKRNDACIQNEWMLHMASFKRKSGLFLHAKRKIKSKKDWFGYMFQNITCMIDYKVQYGGG